MKDKTRLSENTLCSGTGDYIFEMSLCVPVVTSYNQACNYANSPINQINSNDTTSCQNLGDVNVFSTDITGLSLLFDGKCWTHKSLFISMHAEETCTPSGAGVMLQYYHGYYINDITPLSIIYYIECDPSVDGMTAPIMEHVRGNKENYISQLR